MVRILVTSIPKLSDRSEWREVRQSLMSSQKLLQGCGLSLENHWSRPSGHRRSFQPVCKMLMIILHIHTPIFRWGLT